MTINVEDESRMTLPGVDLEGTARQVIEAALDFEGCPYETEVSLLLTDNEGIRVLNREHRGMDRPTDVLSFPMLHFETPADFSEAETEEADCFNPESGELVLGDIPGKGRGAGGKIRPQPEAGIRLSHRSQHAAPDGL